MNTVEIDTGCNTSNFFNRNINGFIHLTVDPGEKAASSEDGGRGGLSQSGSHGPLLLSQLHSLELTSQPVLPALSLLLLGVPYQDSERCGRGFHGGLSLIWACVPFTWGSHRVVT